MSRTFTLEEVSKHNTEGDCWLIVHGKVYDVTNFLKAHPGGKNVLLGKAGQEASKEFDMFHSARILKKYGPRLEVGVVGASSSPAAAPPSAASAAASKRPAFDRNNLFGRLVPYGDPSWYQDWRSPYYNESHKALRAAMREFVDEHIEPYLDDWDQDRKIPKRLWKLCGDAGWLPAVVGPPWPKEYLGTNGFPGLDVDSFDAFHELVILDEVAAAGSGGVLWALFAGLSIGLPPIMHFGSKYLQDKCAKACLSGEKIICLCITEPYAGSDVANLRTTARKTPDGKHYIVNGEKKWITNGVFADFFTVAVRTGGPGMGGISILLLERTMPGITTRQMKCQGVWPSGTTYITFEDVKVPVENLVGVENQGFKSIMYNFNHERWGICVQASRLARVCYEEAFTFAHKRKTFGKRLIDHPVIREKLAHMARRIEATHSWLENITYQLNHMSHEESVKKLGGAIALLKAQCTQSFEFCAREASQIFGGLSYTQGGQGSKVERLYREVRAYAIPGGSEEIMLDLGTRQAAKVYHQMQKL